MTFVIAYLDDDTEIYTSWYDPVTTQPPEGEGFCLKPKSCKCLDVQDINSTHLANDTNYNGVDEAAVNTSLTFIGTWNSEKIKLTCTGNHIKSFYFYTPIALIHII